MNKLCSVWMVAIIGLMAGGGANAQQLDVAREQETELQLVPPQAVPKAGTFWHVALPGQHQLPPYPCPPADMDIPIYSLGNLQFLVDDRAVESEQAVTSSGAMTTMSTQALPPPPGGGGNGTNIPPRPNIANPAKYGAQFFALLDTNAVAQSDSNLWKCVTNFPVAPAGPSLQIKLYKNNCVLVKASHFNYSAETRDFALAICDNPARALWKNLSLTTQDTSDGWLVQGSVPSYLVTDPMWMMISNISTWPAVLRAIPYGGPRIAL